MEQERQLSRREFLKISLVSGSGLIVAILLPACSEIPEEENLEIIETLEVPESILSPSLFYRISSSGSVTVTVSRSEMGQGVRTAFAMILTEELGAKWEDVQVEQAIADPQYGNQVTGGSLSVSESYSRLRRAGASGKQIMLAAAAQFWGADQSECFAENGVVINNSDGKQITYGELVDLLVAMDELPETLPYELSDPKDFQIIGSRHGQIDEKLMLEGKAQYGSDIQLPGMLYAAISRCPYTSGILSSYDASATLELPGVLEVHELSNGVAVIAENTWAAFQGQEALEISWEPDNDPNLSSASIRNELISSFEVGSDTDENSFLEAIYEFPFLAHAPMEPMNCVADVREDSCEIWAPCQNPRDVQMLAGSITQMNPSNVTVNVPLIGGGFGRRLQSDYAREAVELSMRLAQPVKVIWTREDDIRNGYFNPYSAHRASVSLEEPQLPTIRSRYANDVLPIGPWRSVDNNPIAFARESFINEMALSLGRDPLELRLELEPKLAAVLELAAEKAGWGESLPSGWGRGIAAHSTWDWTPVAQILELSVDSENKIIVHRVVCAIDCGFTVNPDMVEAQMEGGIIFALSAALKGDITIDNGKVNESNFHDYPILSFEESPKIETYIIKSSKNHRPVSVKWAYLHCFPHLPTLSLMQLEIVYVASLSGKQSID